MNDPAWREQVIRRRHGWASLGFKARRTLNRAFRRTEQANRRDEIEFEKKREHYEKLERGPGMAAASPGAPSLAAPARPAGRDGPRAGGGAPFPAPVFNATGKPHADVMRRLRQIGVTDTAWLDRGVPPPPAVAPEILRIERWREEELRLFREREAARIDVGSLDARSVARRDLRARWPPQRPGRRSELPPGRKAAPAALDRRRPRLAP